MSYRVDYFLKILILLWLKFTTTNNQNHTNVLT